MSDTVNPIIMGLLFVLRCLIPLGILFGISYLLRRLELVVEHSDEEAEASASADSTPAEVEPAPQSAPVVEKKADGKKKSAPSKKKKEAKR